MFTQNCNIPNNLSPEQIDNEYFLLYYQFLKHAFGLQHSNPTEEKTRIRLYLDDLPDTREKAASFKKFLLGLNKNPQFESAGIYIDENQIAEVRSHDHTILQCLDVVLGAMQFRLNNKHKEKPDGVRCRAKRTISHLKITLPPRDSICRAIPPKNATAFCRSLHQHYADGRGQSWSQSSHIHYRHRLPSAETLLPKPPFLTIG